MLCDSNEYIDKNSLDTFRNEYEGSEHWLARRKFIERHINDYKKNRLLCLSQIFININFLGCWLVFIH